jgi:DNA-binding LytR/AlgR family response regulator
MAGALWLLGAPGLRRALASPPIKARPEPDDLATFDIRDGAALIRIPTNEILAARAAGNYVEFFLCGGRRPLMRASLRNIEVELARAGFLRTHRSWLVNARHVRALVPLGSGDFRIDLDGGESAPLSRRFPEALARLRGEGG